MTDEEFIKINTESAEAANTNKVNKPMRITFLVICCMAIVAGSFIGFSSASTMRRVPKNMITEDKPESMFSISLVDGNIQVIPEKIATKLRTTTAVYDINNGDNQIYSIDIFDDYFYETLFNSDTTKQHECYIGNKVQDIGNFGKDTILDVLDSVEYAEEIIESKSENEKGIANIQSISSLYKEGYNYSSGYYINVETIDKDEFSEFKRNIVNNYRYSCNNETDISKKVNFDGFGILDFNDLDVFTGKFGIMYSMNNGLISVFDEDKDSTVLFITNMNNRSLQNSPIKLIPIEEYKNVYVDFGWRNKADWGYGSFAVMTNSGMYYFKISEAVDNPEEFAQKIIDWLGVKPDDEYIDTGFEFKLTIDDLRDTLENEELKSKDNEDTIDKFNIGKG